jgi:hypothetical protein
VSYFIKMAVIKRTLHPNFFLFLILTSVILAVVLSPASVANPNTDNSVPYPRIANLYGSRLPWVNDEQIKSYLSKLDLIVGVGGYDFHHDWDDSRILIYYEDVEKTIAKLRQIKPTLIVLPYTDMIEGPINTYLPNDFWKLDDRGNMLSTWPGYYRINIDRQDVLEYSYKKIKSLILEKPIFDGVFYDCWKPDPYLTRKTVEDYPSAIVMVNSWNLPDSGYEEVNGSLSEDELNRVLEGKMDFDSFLTRYIMWTKKSRAPHVSTIVCHPRTMNDDPWRWAGLTNKQRQAEMDAARDSDNQMMRIGLTCSMMGDGYFAYDAGTMIRGNWWWYPEFDAKVGQPLSDAKKQSDGTWRREFEGGTVIVNGTLYDTKVHFDKLMEDVSTKRVSHDFTLPLQDGRIYRPSTGPETPEPDIPLTFTASLPNQAISKKTADGGIRFQLPSGLEAFVDASGMLQSIYYKGQCIAQGGRTQVVNPPWKEFRATEANYNVHTNLDNQSIIIEGSGSLTESDSRLGYSSRITIGPGNVILIEMNYKAISDLKLHLWRHHFSFPVSTYKNAAARQGGVVAKLPEQFKDEKILNYWGTDPLVIENHGVKITAKSSISMGLTDFRKYGETYYLWAGYSDKLKFKQGSTWKVKLRLEITDGSSNKE